MCILVAPYEHQLPIRHLDIYHLGRDISHRSTGWVSHLLELKVPGRFSIAVTSVAATGSG